MHHAEFDRNGWWSKVDWHCGLVTAYGVTELCDCDNCIIGPLQVKWTWKMCVKVISIIPQQNIKDKACAYFIGCTVAFWRWRFFIPLRRHDDVIKWKHFPRNWPFAGNSPVPVNSPHNGQWRGALVFSLICVWINDWANNREAGDLRRHRGHYNVNVMRKGPRYLASALVYDRTMEYFSFNNCWLSLTSRNETLCGACVQDLFICRRIWAFSHTTQVEVFLWKYSFRYNQILTKQRFCSITILTSYLILAIT